MRLAPLLLFFVATGASWIDPHATARQASRLYDEGKYAEAAAKYREALVDDPDSALLHYNAGLASYRDGKYEDAFAALAPLAGVDDPARAARAAYAAGNAKYRLGTAAEAQDPQKALGLYAESLAMYRRAMGADPADPDAKLNHEFVEKHIADLKKKLEEQKKQQEQQQNQDQDQQQQQQQQQQQPQDQQGADQNQQQQQQRQDQPQQDQQQQGEQKDQAGREEQQPQGDQQAAQQPGAQPRDASPGSGGEAVAGEPKDGQMSPREAEAILDAQRDQEVRPDEIVKQLQGARVAEPREDW